jgi:hypothetical protein
MIDLTEQERQLIECIREQRQHDFFRVEIELQDGAWNITLTERDGAKPVRSGRGVGQTFDQAWDNINPTWA